MIWPLRAPQLIAFIVILVGVVMLMAGKGGTRTGEQIGLVLVGFLILAMLFGLVVSRAL